MTIHQCTEPGCGLVHDYPLEGPRDSDEVTIARINAERDVAVARAATAAEREYNEARVEVAEVEASAAVDVAEVQAEAIAEVVAAEGEADVEQTPEGLAPVIVEAAPEPEPDVAPPPVSDGSSISSQPKKSLWPYA